jgi:uncharacterized delta-60 repeat protein
MKVRGSFNSLYFLLILLAAGANVYGQTCLPASTAAGALDTCFHGDGSVETSVSTARDTATAVLVQPDGKIVVAGTIGVNESGGTGADFGVVRYNTDGTLDTTFDGDGKLRTNFGGIGNDYAKGIALQADGKIVVAGWSEGGFSFDFAVARYNSDGSLDTSFDGDGLVLTDISGFNNDTATALAIQSDGRIVVVGFTYPRIGGGNNTAVAVRFNSNGSLDTSFDGDGKATLGENTSFYAVALQTDGKIVAGGTNPKLAVARFNTNGSLDTSFGINGIAIYSAFNFGDVAYAVAVEKDGKIVAGGYSRVQSSGGYFCAPMVRFTTAGNIETSSVNCNEAPGSISITALALQPDGKIVASGTASGQNAWKGFLILRYNHALSLDYPFNNGEGGVHVVYTVDFSRLAGATAVALQSDNKIVAVGWNVHHSGLEPQTAFITARLHAGIVAPHPPATMFDFDGDAKADVSVFRRSTNVWYIFQSSNAQVTEQVFGATNDVVAPADFDGDGKTDLGIFRPSSGDWWFKSSITGVFNNFHWGQQGDYARPSDFDGDGKADFIVFRWTNGVWYRYGSTGQVSITPFGQNGDEPLVGDFDGDGKSDLAIYRKTTGEWWWLSSNDGIQRATRWGISTDIAVPADYDGDGKTDFAVFRPSNGVWYILNSADGQATIINFGLQDDRPAAADYDGDGKVDIAVFRPSTGVWYLQRSTAGFAAQQFGVSSDRPVPSAFVPSLEFNVFH